MYIRDAGVDVPYFRNPAGAFFGWKCARMGVFYFLSVTLVGMYFGRFCSYKIEYVCKCAVITD